MITPILANKIQYQNKFPNQKGAHPVFTARYSSAQSSAIRTCNEAYEYIVGSVRWSEEAASHFEKLILKDNIFKANLTRNANQIKDIAESFLSNPYNCLVLLNFPYAFEKDRIFEDSSIHEGLASISYASKDRITKLRKFFLYCTQCLNLKDSQLFQNKAIKEAIKKENTDYLSFLMNERFFLPEINSGKMDLETIALGKNSKDPDIRKFFEDDYLMHVARKQDYRIQEMPINNYFPFSISHMTLEDAEEAENFLSKLDPAQKEAFWAYDGYIDITDRASANKKQIHNIPKAETIKTEEPIYSQEEIKDFFKKISAKIRSDEDKYGQVQLQTLCSIINKNEFKYTKDAPLNVTGRKLQHLLAEIYINPTEKEEIKIVKYIIEKLKNFGTNLDAFDDLGETALKRAVDAENTVVAQALLDNGANPYACSNGADSARKAAEMSNNINIFNMFELHDIRR